MSAARCSSTLKRSAIVVPARRPARPSVRHASTNTTETDWLAWLKRSATGNQAEPSGKALLFAGLGSYPHTPRSPTPSSLAIWEQASEALMTDDSSIGYHTKGLEEFSGRLRGKKGMLRSWVEGRSLDELMARADVTASFILASSIAILASEQERSSSSGLLPTGTTHLAGHGFVGTVTALVAAGHLDLSTGVRLARMYASLPPCPPNQDITFLTTVLSARQFHSLSHPAYDVPISGPGAESSGAPEQRRRAMQLILDEIHALQAEWEDEGQGEWAGASIINSSKVLVVTGTAHATNQVVGRLQQLDLANPVMDIPMPAPFNTELMSHAFYPFRDILQRVNFGQPEEGQGVTILDPCTTQAVGTLPEALEGHLCRQMRWHKTLSRLYSKPMPDVQAFHTVGKGAKGLGIMLRGEVKRRPEGAPEITVEEYGVEREDDDSLVRRRRRPRRKIIS